MTLFIKNIYNYIFIQRWHAGSRQILTEPVASQLMTQMSLYSKHFSTSPILCSYSPILGTIVANKYRDGVFATLTENLKIITGIPETLRKRLRTNQSISEGFSNLIWWGYEYERISQFLEVVKLNTNAMNFTICLGFQIWYSLMPSIILALEYYDLNQILCPEVVKYVKDTTRCWPAEILKGALEQCYNYFDNGFMQAAGGSTSGGGTGAELNDMATFDPLGIRGGEATPRNVVLKKLVIACLAVCILSSVSYASVCGTELCQQFFEGTLPE